MSTQNKPDCPCGTQKTRGYSTYYDLPDGCEVPTKMMVASRYGIVAGLIMGTYDVMMYSHATGFARIMQRYMLHTLPLGLMGATFAAVSNGMLYWRKEDDKLNYFLGGLACGPIVAAYVGSGHGVTVGGIVLGLIAMAKKEAIMHNVTIVPDIHQKSMVNSWRHDWSLAKDPKDDPSFNWADFI